MRVEEGQGGGMEGKEGGEEEGERQERRGGGGGERSKCKRTAERHEAEGAAYAAIAEAAVALDHSAYIVYWNSVRWVPPPLPPYVKVEGRRREHARAGPTLQRVESGGESGLPLQIFD